MKWWVVTLGRVEGEFDEGRRAKLEVSRHPRVVEGGFRIAPPGLLLDVDLRRRGTMMSLEAHLPLVVLYHLPHLRFLLHGASFDSPVTVLVQVAVAGMWHDGLALSLDVVGGGGVLGLQSGYLTALLGRSFDGVDNG